LFKIIKKPDRLIWLNFGKPKGTFCEVCEKDRKKDGENLKAKECLFRIKEADWNLKSGMEFRSGILVKV
jgi:hypothetical protein